MSQSVLWHAKEGLHADYVECKVRAHDRLLVANSVSSSLRLELWHLGVERVRPLLRRSELGLEISFMVEVCASQLSSILNSLNAKTDSLNPRDSKLPASLQEFQDLFQGE